MSAPRQWTVVVPVKGWRTAKSRLAALSSADRSALAWALATDTLETALSTPGVAQCLVVSEADTFADLAHTGAAHVEVPDSRGLRHALSVGAKVATGGPGGVCLLVADLPLLTADALAGALDLATHHPTSVVRDAPGHGTVLLAGRAGAPRPVFGPASARRHVRAGATDLSALVPFHLRRDLDVDADLDDLEPRPGGRVATWLAYHRANSLRQAHSPAQIISAPRPAASPVFTSPDIWSHCDAIR